MASLVGIGNLALAHLGDDATVASIDPPEGSAQAEHIAMFLPIARDVLLEMHDWRFSRFRANLALTDVAYSSWTYGYAQPADCIVLRKVLPFGYFDEERDAADFEQENDTILTNVQTPVAVYSKRVTDPTKWSPLFVSSLSWLLASYIAGPLLKGDTGQAAGVKCYQVFLTEFARASVSSANASKRVQRPDSSASWIAARG
jgi:hypothetical protein